MKDTRPSGAISAARAGRQRPPAPGGRERGDEDGQDDDDAGVAGQPGDAGAQGRRDPVAPREGEEARGGRGQKEALGVAQGQDVGRGAEDVEQDRPVGQPGPKTSRTASQMASAEVSPKTNAATNAASGRLRRVTTARARTASREAGEEGPAAPVALVEQVVRVPVLRDQQVPAAVPDGAHGVDHPQPRDDGGGDEGRADDREPGRARSRRRGAGGAGRVAPGPDAARWCGGRTGRRRPV